MAQRRGHHWEDVIDVCVLGPTLDPFTASAELHSWGQGLPSTARTAGRQKAPHSPLEIQCTSCIRLSNKRFAEKLHFGAVLSPTGQGGLPQGTSDGYHLQDIGEEHAVKGRLHHDSHATSGTLLQYLLLETAVVVLSPGPDPRRPTGADALRAPAQHLLLLSEHSTVVTVVTALLLGARSPRLSGWTGQGCTLCPSVGFTGV